MRQGDIKMTLFIKMPIAPDNPVYSFEDFKVRYLELTEESIQSTPLTNEQETHYLVGSSRLTQEISDQLTSEFPPVSIANTIPVGWITKET